ncbi:hypothetical protein [Lewinella sp. JB7]|uniref:hypothetical protein n=1 Tax=Lewinella sp. JB7 TaxID=2962887 RepID=UPI0020C94F63|nr:hypothetical protein [Lewinella sp. JB7]MCP9235600.1 hypothetical protein [Lewinella sp. JB7]
MAGLLAVVLLLYGMSASEIGSEAIRGGNGSGSVVTFRISSALPIGIIGLMATAVAYRIGLARD